jgi:hypothetical protein
MKTILSATPLATAALAGFANMFRLKERSGTSGNRGRWAQHLNGCDSRWRR